MKTLAQLLIKSGFTPEGLFSGTKYLAMDVDYEEGDFLVYQYVEMPTFDGEGNYHLSTYLNRGCMFRRLDCAASDWSTPLSIEDFKAAYNKHTQDNWPESYGEVNDPQDGAIQGFINNEESIDQLLFRHSSNTDCINTLLKENELIMQECNKRANELGFELKVIV